MPFMAITCILQGYHTEKVLTPWQYRNKDAKKDCSDNVEDSTRKKRGRYKYKLSENEIQREF